MAYPPRYNSLDDLCLHAYVYLDDLLEPYRPQLPKHSALAKAAPGKGPGRKQRASISELLIIAVVGELLTQPFESTWYRTDKARAVGPSSLGCAAALSGPFSEFA